jgi:WD40 repeat protein
MSGTGPQNIGPYEVLGEIGRGGMGAVLKARAPDGRPVAVKVLLSAGSQKALERFERERRLLAELDESEGFVPLLDAGSSPRGPFIVMPYVEGGTLRARLLQGQMPIAAAIELGIALAHALGRAHGRGIVHRDLKPDNVLFTREGKPLVADLGLAKHFSDEVDGASKSASLSKSGVMSGTAGYMAPEQMTDAKNVGPEADVFALGTMLYECLTGLPAFVGETAQETFARSLAGQFDPVRKGRPDAPRWLASVVERCLSKSPAARYPGGSELEAALAAGGAGAPPDRTVVVVAVALALVAASGTAIGLARRPAAPVVTTTAPPPAPVAAPPDWVPHPYADRIGAFSGLCRDFVRTKTTHLTEVFGQYEWKHAEQSDCIAVSPDGKLAMTGGRDATAKVWELATGREVWSFGGHLNGVWAVAFAPDGKHAVSGGWDHEIRYWDLVTGREVERFRGHTGQVVDLAFSPDGKEVLSGSDDGTARLWNVARGSEIRTIAGHGGALQSVAFLPDGKRAVAGGADGTVRLLDLAIGKEIRYFKAHADPVGSVAVSPDGKRILSASPDRTVKLWELGGKLVATLEGHTDGVWRAAFSPDGKRALSASVDTTVRYWDLEAAEKKKDPLIRVLEGRASWVRSVAFSPDGARGYSAGWFSMTRAWDLATGKQLNPIEGHECTVIATVLSPDGKRLFSGSYDGSIGVWDLATGKASSRIHCAKVVTCVAVAPDGRHVLAGNPDFLEYYDVASGRAIHRFVGHAPWVLTAAITADGKRGLSSGSDGTLRAWDLESGLAVSSIPGPFELRRIALYPDGERVLSAGRANHLMVWQLSENAPADRNQPSFDRHGSDVNALDLAPDGQRALSGAEDGAIIVWDVPTLKALATLSGHKGAVSAVALSPDGRLAISAGRDETIRLWDVASGIERDRIDLASSSDDARALVFAKDGRSFYAGTARGVVLHFELGKGK